MTATLDSARRWLAQDPDPETRRELHRLIERAQANEDEAIAEIKKRFEGRLHFGTAGLRGPLQAGPNGMNRVLVAQTAAGIARYLCQTQESARVVIGYDGRRNSRRFAEDSAEILQGAGIRALLLPEMLPTPVLAFAVRALQSAAGIMVTASHNPPRDNGYKVYLGGDDGGSQIIPPADGEIAARIDRVAAHEDIRELPRSKNYRILDHALVSRYIRETAALRSAPVAPLNYVYTALHGVGTKTLLATLEAAGLPRPHLVAAQCTPDAGFPTVAFPNPEEPGALDLAIAVARDIEAAFILANDPDADRLAVAFPDNDGNWRALHGNTIGLVLAWYLAEKARRAGKTGTLACSIVSSPALKHVARHCGMTYAETLTGFKWISRIPNLLFGYEEALGYLVDPDKVHDKDGISAAVCFLDLILDLNTKGETFADCLARFEAVFGVWISDQISIRVGDPAEIRKILDHLRQNPFQEIGGFSVSEYSDHLHAEKPSDMLVFWLAGRHRVIFRPSGTEPKLKIYIDCIAQERKQAETLLEEIKNALKEDTRHHRCDNNQP